MAAISETLNHVILPPPAPTDFWMTDALREVHGRWQHWIDEGCPKDSTITLTDEEFLFYMKQRALRDFYFFARMIMDHGMPVPKVLPPGAERSGSRLTDAFHKDLAWSWQAPDGWKAPDGRVMGRHRMALVPRGCLKTTLLTQRFALWLLCRNPDERILIFTHGKDFARKVFAPIKQTLEGKGMHGKMFKTLFGYLVPSKEDRENWSQNILTVKRDGVWTDASLEATGVGSGVTGGHFSWQLIDDIVDRQETTEQMHKIIGEFDNLTPLFTSLREGHRRIVGTYWGLWDPYIYAQRAWPDILVARRAWLEKGGKQTDELKEENLVFPWLDIEEAVRLKKRNPFFFSCQYELNPRDEGRMGFKRQWFRYFRRRGDTIEELDLDGKVARKQPIVNLNLFISMDPNTGEIPGSKSIAESNAPTKKDHDYCAITVLGVDKDGVWYVLRVIRKRLNPTQAEDALFLLNSFWKPMWTGIEPVAAQRLWFHILRMAMKRRKQFFTLIPWDTQGQRSKPERIKGLIPLYENGMIYHRVCDNPDEQEGMDALEEELLSFGGPQEHDDAMDSLSSFIPLVHDPDRALTEAPKPWSEDVDMLHLDDASARVAMLTRRKTSEDFGLSVPSSFWGPDI